MVMGLRADSWVVADFTWGFDRFEIAFLTDLKGLCPSWKLIERGLTGI